MPFQPINYGNILAQSQGIQGQQLQNVLAAEQLNPNSLQNQLLQAKVQQARSPYSNTASTKAFAPVTLINPQTKEKRMVAPTFNPATGQAALNPYEIPEGFELATETPAEKRSLELISNLEELQKKYEIKLQNEPKLVTEKTTAEQTVKLQTEPEIQKQVTGAKGTATRQQSFIDTGMAAADSIPTLSRSIELLESGVKTGGWDKLKLWATDTLGVTGADQGELSANLGKAVLSQLRSTFGAAFTEREGERLNRIEAGFGKSPAVNLRLLKNIKTIAEREARRGIAAAKSAGDDFTVSEIENAMKGILGAPQSAPRDNSQNSDPLGIRQ